MRISLKRAITDALPVEMRKRVDRLTGWDPCPEVLILDSAREWLLARSLGNGFDPDGYVVTSRAMVKSLRTTKDRAFRKRALQAESMWQTILRAPAIDLHSAATILDSLRRLNLFVIVLRETQYEWYSNHCRIEKVTDNHAHVRGFDGAGQWDRRLKRLNLSEVTEIHFGTRYLNLYQKYAVKIRF